MYMEDFRAHLRVVHKRREFDNHDLSLFESWPGSARFIKHRPSKKRDAVLASTVSAPAQVLSSDDITRIIADGISRGIQVVMGSLPSTSQSQSGTGIYFFTIFIYFVSNFHSFSLEKFKVWFNSVC